MSPRQLLLKQGAWFFLFASIILLAISCRYFQYLPPIKDAVTFFYLAITTISHFVALSFVFYIVIYVPWVLIYPHKTWSWIVAGCLVSITSLLLLIDTFVFNLYRFHINRFVLELLFGGAGSQIFEFQLLQYLMLVGCAILFLGSILYGSFKVFNWSGLLVVRFGKWIALSLVIFMLMSHVIHMWADATNYRSITTSSRYYPLFFPATAKKLMLKMGIGSQVVANDYNTLESKDNSNELNYPLHPIEADSTTKRNIILILIDSWNIRTMDSVTMPNIYHFSKTCEVYDHHYSGSNGTRTGLFSIFYGIPGLYWDAFLATRTSPVFMDVLKQSNYQIEAFASAALTNPPFDRTIFQKVRGVDFETKGNSAIERDQRITQNWLSARQVIHPKQQPLFSFLFYDGLHAISHPKSFKGPYQPEWEYAKYELLNNDLDPTPFFNLYRNSACYIDSLVGNVLDDLRKRNMLDNSWVIITGDHGQEFNENKKNFWGHNGNYSAAQMQVPLIIHQPQGKAKTYHHWTCHYDIVPTLMRDVLKCKNPIVDYSVGKCLNDTTPRNWLLVGSNDNYAILESNRITSIYFDGSFDVTDARLNETPDCSVNVPLVNEILLKSKVYYK